MCWCLQILDDLSSETCDSLESGASRSESRDFPAAMVWPGSKIGTFQGLVQLSSWWRNSSVVGGEWSGGQSMSSFSAWTEERRCSNTQDTSVSVEGNLPLYFWHSSDMLTGSSSSSPSLLHFSLRLILFLFIYGIQSILSTCFYLLVVFVLHKPNMTKSHVCISRQSSD